MYRNAGVQSAVAELAHPVKNQKKGAGFHSAVGMCMPLNAWRLFLRCVAIPLLCLLIASDCCSTVLHKSMAPMVLAKK